MPRSVVLPLGLVFVLVCVTAGLAQPAAPISAARSPEEGRPFIRSYQVRDVGAVGQIWSILQDARGVIYAATNTGVVEFDGANWRRIRTGPGGTTRALAMDSSGRIYVGTGDTFGYLAPDTKGELQFVTLKNKLPADQQNFNDVWRVFATSDGVYFQTEQAIFRWANETLSVIKPASRFNRASLLDDKLYLTMPETGLNVLEGGTFRTLPGTASLAWEVTPVILRYDQRRLLIGTRSTGLYLYDGTALTPFHTGLDASAQELQSLSGSGAGRRDVRAHHRQPQAWPSWIAMAVRSCMSTATAACRPTSCIS